MISNEMEISKIVDLIEITMVLSTTFIQIEEICVCILYKTNENI